MRMWRKPLVTAYQSMAFQKRHAVPFSAAFQQPAARLCDPGAKAESSAYNEPKYPRAQARTRRRSDRGPRRGLGGEAGRHTKKRRASGRAATPGRALPHQGRYGERRTSGKGKAAKTRRCNKRRPGGLGRERFQCFMSQIASFPNLPATEEALSSRFRSQNVTNDASIASSAKRHTVNRIHHSENSRFEAR